jgi:capsular exopolysaccharide synthesis family protein
MVDSIKQAIDLARATETVARSTPVGVPNPARPGPQEPQFQQVKLSQTHLERARIISHGVGTPHGRYYDMLRTQVLQEMDKNSWQFLAVTSPTAACGKTVTACNLAMSIARLPERSVLLVDMDMRKPMVADYLGLESHSGILDILAERRTLGTTLVEAAIGPSRFLVLPGDAAPTTSSEWMASQTMGTLLQIIKRDFRSRIVIFDLPPLLIGDDVISILPRMDAVLLVAGVGTTSVADIKESQKHLQSSNVLRVIVNKVTEDVDGYQAYY